MTHWFSDDYRRRFKEAVEKKDGRTYGPEELEAMMRDNMNAMFAGPKTLLPKVDAPPRLRLGGAFFCFSSRHTGF